MNIEVRKAQGSEVPDVTITITETMPDLPLGTPGPEYLATYAAMFDSDAQKLADVLARVLPGGTLDRLVAKLLLVKASHFVVAHDYERKPE